MSYEDTNCPCGDRKPTDTMLCDACMEDLKDRREMATFRSAEPVECRRHAATILLVLARGRKRRLANNAVRGAAEPRTLDGLVGSSELKGE